LEKFGYGEIDAERLDLPSDVVEQLRVTADWHDHSLNWDHPPDPGSWRQEECDRFNAASKKLFECCRQFLEGRAEILYAHKDEVEDPDLDVYLANPKSFKRMNS